MPVRPNRAPVSTAYAHVLAKLAAGHHIEARRRFPRPYALRLMLRTAYAREVPASLLDELLRDGYVVGRALDARGDAVDFTITDAGRVGAAHDTLPPDPAQLPMFDDQVGRRPAKPKGSSMDSAA